MASISMKKMKETILITNRDPVIHNHLVHGHELLPGLAYIDLLHQFFRDHGHDFASLELANLTIYQPLVASSDCVIHLEIDCSEITKGFWRVNLSGREENNGAIADELRRYLTAEMRRVESIAFD